MALGCVTSRGCSVDTAGDPSALQPERHSWLLSRMLLSVTHGSRVLFCSRCLCGLTGSLIFELWCCSWPIWLTAVMKRIRSDAALMLRSSLLGLGSANPTCYLTQTESYCEEVLGVTEAMLSCFIFQENCWFLTTLTCLSIICSHSNVDF